MASSWPFTVFAPTNAAFEALPAGTVETLVKPENKDQLTKMLGCHVVGADEMSDAIGKMIADDGGTHPVSTVGGCVLQAKMDGDKITLTDENGTRDRHHRRCRPVERRHPRHRQGADAEA